METLHAFFRPLPARQEYALASAASASFHFGEAFYPARLRVDDHAHKNPSVTSVLRGSLTETYPKNRAERCVAGSILFRPPGERHRDVMGEDGSFNLEIELVDGRSLNLSALQGHFERPTQSRHPRLLALAHQIHRELQVHDTAQALVLEGLSLEFFGIASRSVDGGAPGSIRPSWLPRVREIMHDRFQDPLRIAELAELAGVHPVYFARIFRMHYGVTPGVYLRHLRLEWAVQQLGNVNLSLSDIAVSAGFSDQSHFTRAFKQHFGAPPGRLRRLGTA